jgi:hypothetical protein
MRLVVARRLGRRGEGLGNELVGWSKGYLASQALNAKLIGPGWGANKRGYYRHFQTSRLDFVLEELLVRSPSYRFTEEDYWASDEIKFDRAITRWAGEKGLLCKANFVVTVGGMYGGYPSIAPARPFLWQKLLSSKDALKKIYEIQSGLDNRKLFVAVHMRFGSDFRQTSEDESVRGQFNIFIPPTWYMDACEAVRSAFGDQVEFRIFTDKPGRAYNEVVQRFNPGQQRQAGLTEASDLALMAMADLRICSVSSYSTAASFLADGPFLWYEPQLTLESNFYSLWGGEPQQKKPNSLTRQAVDFVQNSEAGVISTKGWPYVGPGTLPAGLAQQLMARLHQKQPHRDLLSYGVIPLEQGKKSA